MTKKQLWNRLRRKRRKYNEDRMATALYMYFATLKLRIQANIRTPGFTDKGYLKRRVDQPLEFIGGGNHGKI